MTVACRIASWPSAVLLVALLGLNSSAIAADASRSEVRKIVEQYAQGLRDADLATLRAAFAPAGQFIMRSRSGAVEARPFATVLPTWVSKPDPQVEIRIISIEMPVAGMASVTAKLKTAPTCYDDQLLLTRGTSGWEIVAKTTTSSASCEGWPAKPR